MNISLSQGVQLISQLNNEIRAKKEARMNASSLQFLRGEEYELTDEVDILSDELDTLWDRVRELKVKLGEKNITTKFSVFDEGFELSLAEALVLVQQIRNELSDCELFSRLKKNPQLIRSYGNEANYVVANLDVERYSTLANGLRRKANRLSTEIDRVNHNTFIEIEWANEYID